MGKSCGGTRTPMLLALHVGLGRSLVEHARIDVDEGQMLALHFSEAMGAGAVRLPSRRSE